MPDERFTWKKQREEERKPPTFPGWQPEFVAERYQRGWQPTPRTPPPPGFEPLAPQIAPLEQARLAQRRGEEQFNKANLIKQINYLQTDLGVPEHRWRDFTEADSIEELQSYLESLEQADLAGIRGGVGRQQAGGGAVDESGLDEAIMRADEMGIATTNARKVLQTYNDPQNVAHIRIRRQEAAQVIMAIKSKRWEAEKIESGILAREFPEEFAEFEKQWMSDLARGWSPTRPRDPRGEFMGAFQRQPEYEETIRKWETEQFQDFPQLFPWYQEAGGRETGKTFQEWQRGEPLAQAYLGEKRATAAIPREIQRPKWQPARR